MDQKSEITMMMEMVFFGNDTIYPSFRDFLNETIKVQKTPYGINFPKFDNKMINEPKKDFFVTYFNEPKSNSDYVVIIKPTKEVIFTEVTDFDTQSYLDTLSGKREQFRVFGKVMYTIIEMMKNLRYRSVFFDGLTPKHKAVYQKLWDNQKIQKEAEKNGLELIQKNNKFYITLEDLNKSED